MPSARDAIHEVILNGVGIFPAELDVSCNPNDHVKPLPSSVANMPRQG